jgi:hypothetical protein
MSPVRYELGFYIPEDDILHSHRRENLKSYILERILLLRVRGICYMEGCHACVFPYRGRKTLKVPGSL